MHSEQWTVDSGQKNRSVESLAVPPIPQKTAEWMGHPAFLLWLKVYGAVEHWSLFAFDGSAGGAFEVKDNYVVGSLLEPGGGEIEGLLRADVPDAS